MVADDLESAVEVGAHGVVAAIEVIRDPVELGVYERAVVAFGVILYDQLPVRLDVVSVPPGSPQVAEVVALHDLRHFHASVMLQNGASLLLVSRRLGHASVSTTGDVYGHLLPGAQKEAADAFAKAMEEG